MPDKETELFYLQRLVSLGVSLPEGELAFSESPDFVLTSLSSGTLGIEITELFQTHESSDGSSRQAQKSMREDVLQLAREINDRSGERPVHAAVFFNRSTRLTKRRVQPLAHELADIIGEARVPPGHPRRFEVGDRGGPALPPEVDEINVTNVGGSDSPRWSALEAVAIPILTPIEIQSRIDKKLDSVASYKERCDTVWLVLAIGSYPLSKEFRISPNRLLTK
ncbi:MAG: hypothetical protein ACYSUN_13065 [Planctomycetota bacterium]|jgi:hypothetical protein